MLNPFKRAKPSRVTRECRWFNIDLGVCEYPELSSFLEVSNEYCKRCSNFKKKIKGNKIYI